MTPEGYTHPLLRKSRSRAFIDKHGAGYILILPALVLILVMMVFPVIQTVLFSFSKVALPRFDVSFIGLDNYRRILSDPETWDLFVRSLVWVVGTVVLRTFLGLGAALLLNARMPGTVLMRVLVILPWTIPSVVGANLWRWIMQTDTGLLNQTLRAVGLESWALNWLADPAMAMATVIVAYSWSGFPFIMLLILARLQGIPQEHYEAAEIDGANGWQKFRFITLPSLKGVLIIALILETVSGINSFDTIMIMTGGGPAGATTIWGIEIYKAGFGAFKFGLAAAYSMMLFFGVLTLFLVYAIVRRAQAKTAREPAV